MKPIRELNMFGPALPMLRAARRAVNKLRSIFISIAARLDRNRPPVYIPKELTGRFTLDGAIEVRYLYRDDRPNKPTIWETKCISETIERIQSRETGAYGNVDLWIYEALHKYPIEGKRVAIVGSADQGHGPWYECMCLAYGGLPTVVEYNKVAYEDPRFEVLHPSDLGREFEAAFSFSSFEHDGLGRYGDPINPDGDLWAMAAWKTHLALNGLLYLTVPLGRDKVVFNCHRIYGRVRLPLLFAGWQVIEAFGFEESLLNRDTMSGWNPRHVDGTLMHPGYPEYSPVFVLRNKKA